MEYYPVNFCSLFDGKIFGNKKYTKNNPGGWLIKI